MKRSDPVFSDRIDQCACRDNKETYGLYGSDPINVGDAGTEHGKNLLSGNPPQCSTESKRKPGAGLYGRAAADLALDHRICGHGQYSAPGEETDGVYAHDPEGI